MVESALVLTVMLVTLFVLFEVGVTAVVYEGSSERARQGARYAAVNPTNTAGIKNMVVYGNAAGTCSPLLGLKTNNVQVSINTLDVKSKATGVVVQVKAYPLYTPFLKSGSVPLTLKVSMPIEP